MPIVVLSANTCWYLYNFRMSTIRSLKKRGFHVCIVAPTDAYSEKLKKSDIEFIPVYFKPQSMNIFTELLIVLKFFKIYKKVSPNVVLNFTPKNNIYGTIACKLLRIPVANNISGLGKAFIKKGLITKILKGLYRISQSRADFIFFQNTSDRDLLESLGDIKEVPSKLIPGSGVDLKKFTLSHERDSKVTRFLMSSRMLKEKGVFEFLEAAKKILLDYKNSVEFRMLGPVDLDGSSAISYAQMMSWHNAGIIRYRGFTDDVFTELVAVDCAVLPSFYGEGVPKSLIEAAAAGKPIITTDTVGCRDVVSNKNGYLCEPRSSQSLELAMRKFLSLNQRQRYEMGLRSRALAVKSFDENFVIEAYLKVVEDLTFK